MKDSYYIVQSDIDVYNKLVESGGLNFARTLNAKFSEIAKKHASITFNSISDPISVEFAGINENYFCYYAEFNGENNSLYVDVKFLKNPNWQDLLKKEIDEKNKKQEIDGIKNILNRYLKIKDRAIDVAREYALLKDLNKSNIKDGIFTLMTSPSDIQKEIVTVLFELSSIAGEIDDQEVFIFPMELLVVDDWKEKLKDYHNSEAEFNKVSIRR